jgi:hypothetical protein
MTQLSHSAVSRYLQCARSYKYHYIDKLRTKVQSGALLFGSAIDEAFNSILLEKGDPVQSFIQKWTFQEINGVLENLTDNIKVVYANSDFDKSLLSSESKQEIKQKAQLLGLDFSGPLDEEIDAVISAYKQRQYKPLTEATHKLYNYLNWISLRHKGLLMISKYIEVIKPKIKRVIDIQKKFTVSNNIDGDAIIGFIDAIVEWHDGRIVILDHKTSSIEYEEDAVLTSPQLALYVFALEAEVQTRTAGFIVFRKHILKNKIKICSKCSFDGSKSRAKTCDNTVEGQRCKGEWTETISPEADVQILINEVPEQTEAIVIENFNDVLHLIKNQTFPRNLNSCEGPYGKCPYFNLCWKGEDKDLISAYKNGVK